MSKGRNDQPSEDEVIDLTDRLAPYAGPALRPTFRGGAAPLKRALQPEASDEPVWKPLQFPFEYQTKERAPGI